MDDMATEKVFTNQLFIADQEIFRGLCRLRGRKTSEVFRDVLHTAIADTVALNDPGLDELAKGKGCLDELKKLRKWYQAVIEQRELYEQTMLKKYRRNDGKNKKQI